MGMMKKIVYYLTAGVVVSSFAVALVGTTVASAKELSAESVRGTSTARKLGEMKRDGLQAKREEVKRRASEKTAELKNKIEEKKQERKEKVEAKHKKQIASHTSKIQKRF